MVGQEILIKVQATKRVEFLQAFEMLTNIETSECKRIELRLFEQINNPNVFLWLEHWSSHESLTEYSQGNKFRAMLGALDVMGTVLKRQTYTVDEET